MNTNNDNKILNKHYSIDLIDSLRRINDASNRSTTLEQMLDNALSEILDIFQCDRVWLLHPCDPDAAYLNVKVAKSIPQWSGEHAVITPVTITPANKRSLEALLASPGPIISDIRESALEHEMMAAFSVKVQLSKVIATRVGKPWLLQLHHCTRYHDFSLNEVQLFNEVVNRLTESLNSMLALKNARHSDERFRTLVEHAPEAILVLDVESNQFIDANINAEVIFGCSRDQLIGKNFSVLTAKVLGQDGSTDALLEQYIDQAMIAGEVTAFEWLFEGEAQNSIVCEVRLVHFPSDEGVLLRGSITDISERKLNESKMLKFSTALQQTADAVIITDSGGTIEYVNAAFEVLTGYSYDEAIGAKPEFFGSGEQDNHFYDELWRTIKSGKVFNDILINRRKDGMLFYEEKTITPLKDADGRITHFIFTGRDITERIESQERLRFMAHHDALTQLPNRSMMMDRLTQAITRAKRDETRVAILFIDIDHFKMINDTLGHDIGDSAIKEVSRLLLASLRASDTVVRFGGDEFVVLLEEVYHHDEVTHLVKKVQAAFNAPLQIQEQELYISASIGVTLCPDDGKDASTLLKHADIAMYRAKEHGRNRYEFYSSEMGARAYERLTFETCVRNAVKQGAFELYYQPQFALVSNKLIGVEALLRWFPETMPAFMADNKAGVQGEISPDLFVPILEETGLIIEVGAWVLETACAQLKSLQTQFDPSFQMAVNLSSRQFRSAEFDRDIEQIIAHYQLDPATIELEITETLLMEQHQLVSRTLNRIDDMGVRLSLDDFGTGYSSLSYLKRFPIDTLKIDRSFVRDVCDDPDDRAIVTAIIAMARSLKLNIVAEGVETEAQVDFLKGLQCDSAQGFHYSQALHADDLSLFLADSLKCGAKTVSSYDI